MYRMGIWLFVLALVFNGVSAYAQLDPSNTLNAMAHGDVTNGHDVNIQEAIAHDLGCADHMVTGAAHSGHHHGPEHSHLKCCARCSMVNLLPGVILVPVTFAFRSAVFYAAQHDLVGRTVASDPHIPKPVV